MSSSISLLAIVDLEGHIIAAQLTDPETVREDQETPSVTFQPLEGQRVVSIDVPREMLALSSRDLYQFFSRVKVNWPASIEVPKIEIIRKE